MDAIGAVPIEGRNHDQVPCCPIDSIAADRVVARPSFRHAGSRPRQMGKARAISRARRRAAGRRGGRNMLSSAASPPIKPTPVYEYIASTVEYKTMPLLSPTFLRRVPRQDLRFGGFVLPLGHRVGSGRHAWTTPGRGCWKRWRRCHQTGSPWLRSWRQDLLSWRHDASGSRETAVPSGAPHVSWEPWKNTIPSENNLAARSAMPTPRNHRPARRERKDLLIAVASVRAFSRRSVARLVVEESVPATTPLWARTRAMPSARSAMLPASTADVSCYRGEGQTRR